MPAGYEKPELKHQKYESVVMVISSSIYYTVFRIAHMVEGRNPPNLTGTLYLISQLVFTDMLTQYNNGFYLLIIFIFQAPIGTMS